MMDRKCKVCGKVPEMRMGPIGLVDEYCIEHDPSPLGAADRKRRDEAAVRPPPTPNPPDTRTVEERLSKVRERVQAEIASYKSGEMCSIAESHWVPAGLNRALEIMGEEFGIEEVTKQNG